MEQKPEEETPSRYGADITVLMPGNQKPSTYHIEVGAAEPIEATARALEEWKTRTEPRDVRVRKLDPPKEEKKP